MGKSQKKRAVRRHNPVRVPDSHLPKGLEAAVSTSEKSEAVLPIIQKLQGPEAQDRTWACSAVSNLIQNDPSTRRLLQGKNIVGALINRLSDSVEDVVVEAAGALRNLCIDGGYEICAEMYNKNILAPLKTFIPKISTALHQLLMSPKSASENDHSLVFGFAENVITIIWCLSETSNKALNAINQISLVPFLMAFLENRQNLAPRTVAAAAQCLYVLTDDNDPAIEDVRSNSAYTSTLLAITDSNLTADKMNSNGLTEDRLVNLQILAAGILKNISPIPLPSAAAAVDIDRTVVMPLLVPVISSISLSAISDEVSDLLSKQEPIIDKSSLKHTPRSDHKTPSELDLERIEGKLRTVQLSLEILTGVCATLPDPAPEPEFQPEGDKDMDEEASDPDGAEMDLDGAAVPNGPPPTTVTQAPTLLPTILEPLLWLIQPVHLSFPPLSTAAPSPHAPTTSALSAIHIGALECLNNVFLALAVSPSPEIAADVASGTKVWDALWDALGKVGLEGGRGQERRREMWEVAVGVLWSVGNIWKGRLVPNEEQVQVLMQLCNSSNVEQVKVKCIGTLECLAQHPQSIDANKMISTYLLSLMPTPSTPSLASAESVLQATSAIIDIYSDETLPYDITFRQGGFLERLSSSVDGIKRAVKGIDRRKEGGRDLRRRGDEILENLVAFIAYRKDLKL